MTFSISGRCPKTGMLGIAIASSSPAVAARCAHARAGAGVVATQNITDPSLGPKGLELMARGATAAQALGILCQTERQIAYRQLALVDREGRTAAFSGGHALGIHAIAEGPNGSGVVAVGNLLADMAIPQAMVAAFLAAGGALGERLLAAMKAAVALGGEAGPIHSAGLIVVDRVPWPIADLRVIGTRRIPSAGSKRSG